MLACSTSPAVTITTNPDRCWTMRLAGDMARENLVAVAIFVTSLDAVLSAKLEPRCAAASNG